MANIQERRDKSGKLISYSIRVFRGRDANGKQLKPWTATFEVLPTWTEKSARKKAEAYAATFEKSCLEGMASDSRITFSKYGKDVLALRENRQTLKHGSLVFYRAAAARVDPFIGSLKLKDIRPEHLNKLYTELLKPDAETGKALSAATVRGCHHYISMVFSQAVREGLIAISPASRVELPKVSKKEPEYFQPDQIAAIMEALETEPLKWKTLLHTMMVTGCRRGEVLGLAWKDVDFEAKQIHVRQSVLYRADRGIYIDTPKTASGDRRISIPEETVSLLRQYRTWQLEERLRLGAFYQDQGLIFSQDNGSPMHPDSVTTWCDRFSKRHNLPHIHPHSFRHSAASFLVYGGADLASIAHRLGHAQVSTTMDIYSHAIAQADERNADILANVMLKKAKQA